MDLKTLVGAPLVHPSASPDRSPVTIRWGDDRDWEDRVIRLRRGEMCTGRVRGRGRPAEDGTTWIVEHVDSADLRLRLWSGNAHLDERLARLVGFTVKILRTRDLVIDGRSVPDYLVTPTERRPTAPGDARRR